MKLFKTAFRNIKRRKNEYGLYIGTCILAIAAFYSLIAFTSKEFITKIVPVESTSINFEGLVPIITIISLCVLSSMLIYVNSYIIKRREKEFAVLSLCGMNKSGIAKLLACENLIVTGISLPAGIIPGIFFSRFLQKFTAGIFDRDFVLKKAVFVSTGALLYTITVFISLAILSYTVSLLKLTTLTPAALLNRRSENKKSKKFLPTLLAYLAGWIILAIAYKLAVSLGFANFDKILPATLLGVLGNYLVFYGIFAPSYLFNYLPAKIYNKKLRFFTSRQLFFEASQVSYMLGTAALCLFFALGTMGLGISINKVLKSEYKESESEAAEIAFSFDYLHNNDHIDTRRYSFDAAAGKIGKAVLEAAATEKSAMLADYKETLIAFSEKEISQLEKDGFSAENAEKLDIRNRLTAINYCDAKVIGVPDASDKDKLDSIAMTGLEVFDINYSDEHLRQLKINEVDLNSLGTAVEELNINSYLISRNIESKSEIAEKLRSLPKDKAYLLLSENLSAKGDLKADAQIEIKNPLTKDSEVLPLKLLESEFDSEECRQIKAFRSFENMNMLIMPEKYDLLINAFAENAIIALPDQQEKFEKGFIISLEMQIEDQYLRLFDKPQISPKYFRKLKTFEASTSGLASFAISFVSIYIGLILLAAAASVMAMRQLEQRYSMRRSYALLYSMGCSKGQISRLILRSVFLYFLLPPFIAAIHSIFGIKMIKDFLNLIGRYEVSQGILPALLIIAAIWLLYLFAAAIMSLNSIKSKNLKLKNQ